MAKKTLFTIEHFLLWEYRYLPNILPNIIGQYWNNDGQEKSSRTNLKEKLKGVGD